MAKGRKRGSWKCKSCQKWAKPGMVACPHCGAEREVKKKRGAGISVKERSEAQKKAERDSGVGSTDMKKMGKASEAEKRRMRGRALTGSLLALDIDRAVWGRYEARRRGE